jgi:hypothetical protein
MSTYDDASLVLVPSGYKNGVVFSQKPMDANGQLTFTRASGATRVGPNGYIEKVRTNLALQSQTFDNPSWVPNNTTVTANAETAPDGTLTADTMTLADSTSYVSQPTALGAGTYTISCYVKVISTTTAGEVRFNIVYDATAINLTFTPTGDWQRVEGTFTATTGVTTLRIRGGFGTAFVGTLAIWGFQAEVSDFGPTDYIPTTTAAVSVGPVSGTPRLDYLNGECPSLLLEPQRTNLFTYSEQLNNAAWSKNNTTITANAAISPDGYMNADKMQDSTSGAIVTYTNQNPATSGTQYTSSGFFKKAEYNFVLLHAFGLGGAVFNLNTGVLVSQSGGTGTITSYGDGWYRCTYTFTATGGGVFFTQTPTGSISYTGTAGSGIYAYGLQVEAGAYATSYIPTLGTSVTRVADACSKTGISSLIGQTEGTLFVEFSAQPEGVSDARISISDGSSNNWIFLSKDGIYYRAFIRASGTLIISNISEEILDSSVVKMAIAYKSGEIAYYFNGTLRSSSNSFSFNPTLDSLIIGNTNIASVVSEAIKINQLLLFPTRLTNAQLAELTTL